MGRGGEHLVFFSENGDDIVINDAMAMAVISKFEATYGHKMAGMWLEILLGFDGMSWNI